MARVDADDGRVNLVYCLGDAGQNVIATGSFHAELINMMANNLAVMQLERSGTVPSGGQRSTNQSTRHSASGLRSAAQRGVD